jgi:Tfp pilus assembly protein PilF
LDSFYTEPYSYLGDIYFAKEDWKKSDFYYSEYLKFYPNEATILNNYAYSLIIREENLPYALSMIERAIEQKPDDPNFLDTYGWYFYKVGQYEEARKYIEKSIQIDSSRAEPFLHLSLIYKALGDETKAKENFEKAVSIDPNNKEIIKEMNKTK